jgi:hypothetical protein
VDGDGRESARFSFFLFFPCGFSPNMTPCGVLISAADLLLGLLVVTYLHDSWHGGQSKASIHVLLLKTLAGSRS